MLYNIGVWGRGSKNFNEFVAISRDSPAGQTASRTASPIAAIYDKEEVWAIEG